LARSTFGEDEFAAFMEAFNHGMGSRLLFLVDLTGWAALKEPRFATITFTSGAI
jgi:hypothetical protein